MQAKIVHILDLINEPLAMVLLVVLFSSGLWFSFRTGFVQIRMIPQMLRLLFHRTGIGKDGESISPVKAFLVSLGARVGTGNLVGVATAIAIGGPGAVFWMWIMAILGGVNAFLENTLAQLFKVHHGKSFIGGPAYYISKGLHKKWFAYVFAVALLLDFGLSNNMLQSNVIAGAFEGAFHVSPWVMAIVLTLVTLIILFGGIKRISRVSAVIVPFMAIAYILLTLVIMVINWRILPDCFMLIIDHAFGLRQGVAGSIGTAIIIGFKRGLFSNEAGLGSSPNAAATATTKHPVTQGLIQAFGIYTDTIIICTCTAFIILCSGLYDSGLNGIDLTQAALCYHVGPTGNIVVAVLIFFFAFSSIIANAYYGEANVRFMVNDIISRHAPKHLQRAERWPIVLYRISVAALVCIGCLTTVEISWGVVDLTQSIMAICNITAIFFLGKYAIRCLKDYRTQLKQGKVPEYHKETIPEIQDETECW